MRVALLASTVLFAAPALAQDATWLAAPGTNDIATDANWSSGTTPTGVATFGASSRTSLTTSTAISFDTFVFNVGAPAYTFATGAHLVEFDGLGIVNNSSNAPTFNVTGALTFANSSNGGNAIINATGGSTVSFTDSSNAGSATITSSSSLVQFSTSASAGSATLGTVGSGEIRFRTSATAASAAITVNNGGLLAFQDSATANNATVTVNNGGTAAFAGTSTGGNARFIVNTGGSFDITGLTGGFTGMTAGSIEGAGNFCICDHQFTVGSNNLSTTVSGVIDGLNGSLVKTGTGTLTLTATNTYTGATVVNGGILAINGNITASSGVTVNAGGTLGGTGTLPATTISGGTLAPGNSVGTITVNGNLGFTSASIYRVEISGTTADRTNVTGTATLAGTVQPVILSPPTSNSTTYTILSATGGRSGTFAVSNPANYVANLSYTTTDVLLTLTAAIGTGGGLAPNQQNPGTVIDTVFNNGGTLPSGFATVYGLSGASLVTALSQLSGEGATGAPSASFLSMNQFLSLMINPFGSAAGGSGPSFQGTRNFAAAPSLPPAVAEAYAAVTPKQRRRRDDRWSLWGASYGGSNAIDGEGGVGSHDLTARNYGFVAGADYRAGADTTLGFALGGTGINWDLSSSLGGGRSDAFQLGLYGSHKFGAAYLAAALAYAWHHVSTDRTVTVSGTDRLTAGYNANHLGARIEGGYRLATAFAGVTPYAAAQWQSFRTPAYSESVASGSNQYALSYGANTTTDARVELGAWFDKIVPVDTGALALRGRAAWVIDSDRDRSVSALFQTLPGSSRFTVSGASPAANAALLSAGAEYRVAAHTTVGAKIDAELAARAQSYAASANLRTIW